MIQSGKANCIIDAQWGSTGKGKLAGYLYNKYPEITVAVCDFMPNAGHTYVDDDGISHITKALPSAISFDHIENVIIGPHAVIEEKRLLEELQREQFATRNFTLHIHPLTTILSELNSATERATLNHVASTMQGSCASVVNKMWRDPAKAHLAKDCEKLADFVCDTHALMQRLLRHGKTALLETAQGFDLGLNNGYEWPYCTSRDCMVGRVLDNAGVSIKDCGSIIASLRTFPIRVGNTPGGFSGPIYDDQEELTWAQIGAMTGIEVEERTTVTKRVRRVFTWSDTQIKRFLRAVKPDYAFLNFVNYLSKRDHDKFINEKGQLLSDHGCKLSLLGTGAKNEDMKAIKAMGWQCTSCGCAAKNCTGKCGVCSNSGHKKAEEFKYTEV
ncbi:adenylosuccinate synthetase [Candidatus Pacearchaeota archaeon]|nr:adenylosuccinate synthetase [Candidatus Pacearchaeota archaeon]